MFSIGNRFTRLIGFMVSGYFWTFGFHLYINNLAWAESGILTNKVVEQLKDYCQRTNRRFHLRMLLDYPPLVEKNVCLGANMVDH